MPSRKKIVGTRAAFIIFAIVLCAEAVYAWSGPPAGTPPACPAGQPGCDAPLNISGNFQSKDGNLMVNAANLFATGFSVPFGNVGIGTANPGTKLEVVGTIKAGTTPNPTWGDLIAGTLNTNTVYAYSLMCVGNASGTCGGAGGMVIKGTGVQFPDGTTQTTAATSIGADPTFNSVYLANGNLRLYQGPGTALHVQTAYGYTDIGAQNSSWTHIYSDKNFYFNQNLYINGNRVYADNYRPYADSAGSATYGRYVYNNGAYSGSGWVEPSSLGVYYAYLGRLVYNNGAYSGSGWIEPSDLGVRYANSAGSVNCNSALCWNSWNYGNYYQTNGDIYMGWAGNWLSTVLSQKYSSSNPPPGTDTSGLVPKNTWWGGTYTGSDGNIYLGFWGKWLSTDLSERATHRGEGTNFVDYSRYVYNNGAYSGSGWVEPSSLGVYYAYLGRLVYNNGAYSGSGWIEPSDLGVRYANSAGSAAANVYRTGDTMSGTLTVNGSPSNWAGVFSGNGPYGLYAVNSSGYFDYLAYSNYALYSNGYIYVGGSIQSGTAMYAPAFYYSSDESLKKDIVTIPNALANVEKLRGVTFDWKADGKSSIGVIAQEVEKVYPELVQTDKETGLKSVEYGNLVGPLIEAVKELAGKVKDIIIAISQMKDEILFHTKQIGDLQAKVVDQQKSIDELQQQVRELIKNK